MRIPRYVLAGVVAFLPLVAYGAGSGMGGSSGSGGGMDVPSRSPEQLAVSSYNSGLKHKARAESYLTKAKSAKNDKDRDKNLKRANDQFRASVKDYRKSIGYNNGLYQAMNELGFAYRKLGDYQNALKAYNTALLVKPDFAPAIEYRGEAYLALGMFEETKSAYLELFRADQDHATLLMQALDEWAAGNGPDSSPEAKALADWIGERKKLAEVTQASPGTLERTW